MRTLGLDIATHTGLALIGETVEDQRVKLIEVNQKGFGRLQSIAAEMERTLLIWKPDRAVVEAYAHSFNVDSFIRVVECGTVIKSVLHRLKIPWIEVPPTVLKKWVTGSGAADKDQMALWVEKRWGLQSTNTDIVDAFALAQMGRLEPEVLQLLVHPAKKAKKKRKGV